MTSRPTPRLLAAIFFRLGCTAFGGPAAHIAMMQREFVEQRGWISPERFLDMLGAINLIPGPNSTELAISIGAELGGRRGLIIAGICFIVPAFSIVLLLAWLYEHYGSTPDATAILAGITPVVIAIIAQAFWKLAASITGKPVAFGLAVLVFAAGLLGAGELPLLLGSGVASVVLARLGVGGKRPGIAAKREQDEGARTPDKGGSEKKFWLFGGLLGGFLGAPGIWSIFLYFLYLGSVLYGSGYVLIAFLRADLVGPGSLGWLTERQLLDAVAVGQVTPGPLFTTATFIGYILGGVPGSVAGTVGIFLPSFIFVLLTHRWIARLRAHGSTAPFLDGVNAGALALIGVALVLLGAGTLVSPLAWVVALVSLGILIGTRVNATWLVGAGGVVGWVAG